MCYLVQRASLSPCGRPSVHVPEVLGRDVGSGGNCAEGKGGCSPKCTHYRSSGPFARSSGFSREAGNLAFYMKLEDFDTTL